jgi:hypothetical protein
MLLHSDLEGQFWKLNSRKDIKTKKVNSHYASIICTLCKQHIHYKVAIKIVLKRFDPKTFRKKVAFA